MLKWRKLENKRYRHDPGEMAECHRRQWYVGGMRSPIVNNNDTRDRPLVDKEMQCVLDRNLLRNNREQRIDRGWIDRSEIVRDADGE